MADPLSTYQLGNIVNITRGRDHILSGKIIRQLLVNSPKNACRVVVIEVLNVNPKLPEDKRPPPSVVANASVVAKVYDHRFLWDVNNIKPKYPSNHPRKLCRRERAAYESLGKSGTVNEYLAPYHGRYTFTCDGDTDEYPTILLGFFEKGFCPKGRLSREAADRLVKDLKPVIEECHRLGFTHGDLQARNLLVKSTKGDFIILDWANSINVADWSPELFNDECRGDMDRLKDLAKELISTST